MLCSVCKDDTKSHFAHSWSDHILLLWKGRQWWRGEPYIYIYTTRIQRALKRALRSIESSRGCIHTLSCVSLVPSIRFTTLVLGQLLFLQLWVCLRRLLVIFLFCLSICGTKSVVVSIAIQLLLPHIKLVRLCGPQQYIKYTTYTKYTKYTNYTKYTQQNI